MPLLFARLFSLRAPIVAFGALLLLMVGLTRTVYAATLPAGFSETVIASDLTNPTAFAFAPDGRIFVTLQGGAVRVIKNNALLATPFVSVTTTSVGERGLLGIALHPQFPTTPYVYVYYTVPGSPPHNRISRFSAGGDTATGGEEILINLEDLSGATNHNGGALHFGSDGKLYVAVGENAAPANAQTLANRLGKILRYNDDGTIPADNPFHDGAGPNVDAIWAYGLRNPFTFTFQPGTGRMFINDVGQGTWEEINDGIAGSNYAWNTCEGFCNPPNANFRDPLLAYPHSGGAFSGCAIVGGAFYNPTTPTFPSDYAGDYFFADLCSGWIRRYDIATNTSVAFAGGISTPVDLYVANDGALYYLARGGGGTLTRVVFGTVVTNTPISTLTRTNTPVPNTPTWTRTNTPIPNTATRTRTNTPVPNTATRTRTNTPVPNTATRTRTNTTVPPTATRTATNPPPSATRTPTVANTPANTRTPTRTRTVTPTPTAADGSWVFCANSGKLCAFTGTHQVRFGAGNKYNVRTYTDGVICNVPNFGDPFPGTKKHCDVK